MIKADKLQHHVFYVKDLEKSKAFYTELFDVQFSARNHQDSSAAMRMSDQAMYFFSFGHYHHDICLVQNHHINVDHGEMMHMSFQLRDKAELQTVKAKLLRRNQPWRDGRMIASARLPEGTEAICFQDPNGHWIELIG